MKYLILIALLLAITVLVVSIGHDDVITNSDASLASPSPTPKLSHILDVPYINEAPSGDWTGPWKNACEEASIAMVEFFYEGAHAVTIPRAEAYMQTLFDRQDEIYGSNTNADAEQFKHIINTYSSFQAEILRNPSIDDIKRELDEGRPVISLHYGFDLKNPNIPFLASGTSYHAMVIIGYDDEAGVFIVNDDGDIKDGAQHKYEYALFMNSLTDYRHSVNKADGSPTVLLTK